MAQSTSEQVGRTVEFGKRTWVITQFDDLSSTPLVKQHQASMGYIGFAVAVSEPTGRQRRRYEAVMRVKADGSFDRAF